ncbi:hypothetical protein [Trichlorobacter lovleyi]|uniref:Glycosyltransferase RgtA/B/C/D-like domain-containing protein n=1 Tax=Trichlorobacter lovleyi (strain ATCC BAA-1151 / DSM 17278 / SZ) TaxID=398767 RepID=B3E3J1_TRIL1|nr:hypothetical protein [Trichlorobacter lovleyi]ACD95810.1 hypothetical protein Glov_2094 [Trichlorobacter lovleyi SZ]
MQKLSVTFQIMAISALVLLVFYPTQFGEICLVDDLGALAGVFGSDTSSLRNIFSPQNMGGGYYRPLIGLSYLLDKKLWFLQHQIMHFESVVAHLLNGILVFYITRTALNLVNRQHIYYLPLFSALLFTLHPITTESVNWLSGRTDVMMGTFILAGTLSYLYFLHKKSKIALLVSIIAVFFALLAKEAAFGFLIGVSLLVIYTRSDGAIQETRLFDWRLYLGYYSISFLVALFTGCYWAVAVLVLLYFLHIVSTDYKNGINFLSAVFWKKFVLLIIFMSVAVGLFFLIRQVVFLSSVNKISQTIILMLADKNYTLSMFIGALGFYVKKFFIPLPLNFFILEIDPLYDFIGIAVLLLTAFLLHKRTLASIFLLLGLSLLLPALPFVFGTIAWTAYAERYIYLSTAFFIIGLCLWIEKIQNIKTFPSRYIYALLASICLIAACITFSRNQTWVSNVTLFQDTVSQNQKIRKLRNIYIHALVEKGFTDEALDEYSDASTLLPSPDFDEQAEVMIASKLREKKMYNTALCLYQKALARKSRNLVSTLKATVLLIREMQDEQISARTKYDVVLKGLELEYLVEHYRLSEDLNLFYSGIIASTQINKCEAAKQYFDAAVTIISEKSPKGKKNLGLLKHELKKCNEDQ